MISLNVVCNWNEDTLIFAPGLPAQVNDGAASWDWASQDIWLEQSLWYGQWKKPKVFVLVLMQGMSWTWHLHWSDGQVSSGQDRTG